MDVRFSYDVDKDVENFIRSSASQNNTAPTALMRRFLGELQHDLNEDTVRTFLERFVREEAIDTSSIRTAIQNAWMVIGTEFVQMSDIIFGIKSSFWPINGYLSTNSRCTYNIKRKQFFVYMLSDAPAANIMHELLHFYTWEALHDRLVSAGVGERAYNDFKEALTVLLNIEYRNLMRGAADKGYPQHAALRDQIRLRWIRDRNLNAVVDEFLENEKSRATSATTIH